MTSAPSPRYPSSVEAHYLNAIRVRLETLYQASTSNPQLREQLSDEVDWIDAQIDATQSSDGGGESRPAKRDQPDLRNPTGESGSRLVGTSPDCPAGVATGPSEPITHRWRSFGAHTWIYDPETEWLEDHKFEVEWEPVYGAPKPPVPAQCAGMPVQASQFWEALKRQCAATPDKSKVKALVQVRCEDVVAAWNACAAEIEDTAQSVLATQRVDEAT